MLFYLLSSIETPENQDKFQYIYDNFHDDMIRFARSRLRNAGEANYELDAEDIVQEALCRIVKYIDGIDIYESRSRNLTYIFSIVVNVINDYFSDKEYCESFEDHEAFIDNDEDFVSQLNVQKRYADVVKAMGMLGEKYQIIFNLRYGEDKSVDEIARRLDMPRGTVYTRLERGRKMLLDILEVKGNG